MFINVRHWQIHANVHSCKNMSSMNTCARIHAHACQNYVPAHECAGTQMSIGHMYMNIRHPHTCKDIDEHAYLDMSAVFPCMCCWVKGDSRLLRQKLVGPSGSEPHTRNQWDPAQMRWEGAGSQPQREWSHPRGHCRPEQVRPPSQLSLRKSESWGLWSGSTQSYIGPKDIRVSGQPSPPKAVG